MARIVKMGEVRDGFKQDTGPAADRSRSRTRVCEPSWFHVKLALSKLVVCDRPLDLRLDCLTDRRDGVESRVG